MTRHSSWSAGVLTLLLVAVSAQRAPGKPFTVAEEIELAHFGDPYGGETQGLQFSPDGNYFAALTERGRIDLNRPEDTLRVYRSQDVLSFLRREDGAPPPPPLWSFNRSTDKDGPLITHWRWLKDSSGIAFLERGTHGSNRLVLADLKNKTVESLTPDGASIKTFDIRDRKHYVYAVADPGLLQRAAAEGKAAAIVGTGRSLPDLLFPADENPYRASWADRSQLWAAVGGKPFQVKDRASGQFLVLFAEGQRNLALSPDGQSLVTALALAEIPLAWEKLYLPPFEASSLRLRAGKQDLATFDGDQLVSRYVHIDLRNGTVQSLSDAPTSVAVGWGTEANPVWSEDGTTIGLPGAYVASATHAAARACIAVVSLNPPAISCVEPIEGPNERGGYSENSYFVDEIRFADAGAQRLVLSYTKLDASRGATEYHHASDGSWIVAHQTISADPVASGGLEVRVKQGLNDPPVLMATDSKTKISRIIWDPNPQLKEITLGEATAYQWKDKDGRDWKGGLFKPVQYEAGHRYPMVIQAHGFYETEFRPSGVYPTAFAARALADAGVVVLQVRDCPIVGTPEEGSCNVAGYESAVSQLVKGGLVDPDRIGIIGFSRTCFYVMQTLTTSTLHIKAASITDGVMIGYLQYLTFVDMSGNAEGYDYDSIVGAQPFGQGLHGWLQHAPLFNMDKVSAALQVVAEGRSDLTFMWEPYAAMRYLHKPVDLILLNNNEHVLSNPAARLASQGGAVDWMRFWLQDYEDPSPVKSGQYVRWRELRKLRDAEQPPLAPSSVH